MNIRLYQHEAVSQVFEDWKTMCFTSVILPTGCGKTRVASEVIKRFTDQFPNKRCLFLAHREELIFQAKRQIHLATGIECEIEMGNIKASESLFSPFKVLISTIQTQCAGSGGGRMKKFKPDEFGVVIIDEFHHATASTYRKVLDYYKQNPDIKILGLTATPDRADGIALGSVCEHVSYKYEIHQAIEDGWLVPIVPQVKHLVDLDFSHIRTTAGDLNGADLAAVMEDEKNTQALCDETVRVIGTKKAIVFMASVRHSEMCCNIFNRHKPDMATWISGDTPREERRKRLKDFTDGKVQVLANCGIATEGFDCPDVEVVVIGRPTKSRALFTQMVGRGTRSLTGTLDDLHSVYERREAIASSKKPHMILLEFTGNSGKHKLVCAADVLGGKYPDEVKELAKKKSKEPNNKKTIGKLLEESEDEIQKRIEAARRAEEARKQKIIARATYRTTTTNLFDRRDTFTSNDYKVNHGRQYTENQRKALVQAGHNPDQTPYWKGCQILAAIRPKQAGLLIRFGYTAADVSGMSFKQASQLIDAIAKNGWKRPSKIDAADIPQMANA